ncbi:MAG: family 16 glycoside hydrolase [Bryobacteraceae bacterium]
MTTISAQTTDFSRDILGRYTCNGLDEAFKSTDTTNRPDARPFDVVIIGGGSFGGIVAQHLFSKDVAHQHRILVLEGGPLALAEHVQNLPVLGLSAPGPVLQDPGVPRAEVWGLPWRTDVAQGFPGLAYCLGGRSLFFGGWSPRLLDSEMPAALWPATVIADLTAVGEYFDQAADQIGTSETNDFIFGPMHEALRAELRTGVDNGDVSDAIPLAQLPLHLNLNGVVPDDALKLEAPLAVQARPPRAGFFPFNKFSSIPLLIETARLAQSEVAGDDIKKRLMVVPNCHVRRLITDGGGNPRSIVAVETNQGVVPVPSGGVVVLALGTIESARLALISFPGLPSSARMGANLMAHLRSNLTIRIPRSSLSGLPPGVQELQASALFVKGRHDHPDHKFGHFHLQITAAGLDVLSADSEAELFKKIPDVDTYERFKHITDDQIVITIRGIGELRPNNPNTRVTLTGELDEFHLPRAFVSIQPTSDDNDLWNAMDKASDDVALIFANGQPYEVLKGNSFVTVAAGQRAQAVLPVTPPRRDGLGTTHHEAGTLVCGDLPASSVTNADLRFHEVTNCYAAGPAVFASVGSPNPMLTGTALARRLADKLSQFAPAAPDPGFTMLFNGMSLNGWRMSAIRNQPGRDDPGRFMIVDGALEGVTGTDLGLLWHTLPTPPNFVLRLEWRTWRADDNSGVFVRFPDPEGRAYNNTAFVGVDYGFEVQIDALGQPDGAAIHKTGAVYNFQAPTSIPTSPLGQWNAYEIRVEGQRYRVKLNGSDVTDFTFTAGSDAAHPDRGFPSTIASPRFIGLQTHTGRTAFRRIQIMAL